MITVSGFKKDGSDYLSYGSGVVVSESGIVLTNKHLIPDPVEFEAFEISCSMGKLAFRNKRWKIDDQPIAIHPTADLALLQIDEFSSVKNAWPIVKSVKLGDSARYDAGDDIYVISFPEAMPLTIHRGMINGPDDTDTLWRTDAPLNPGSSGGLVIGSDAEGPDLASIATVKGATRFSRAGVPTDGWGYVIPAKEAAPLFELLHQHVPMQANEGADQGKHAVPMDQPKLKVTHEEEDVLRLVDRVRPNLITEVTISPTNVYYRLLFKPEVGYIVTQLRLESFDENFRISDIYSKTEDHNTVIWFQVSPQGDLQEVLNRHKHWRSFGPDDVPLILTTVQMPYDPVIQRLPAALPLEREVPYSASSPLTDQILRPRLPPKEY